MKNRAVRTGAEGRLLAGLLCLILAAALGVGLNRQPRERIVAPVHCVSEEALERAWRVDINAASAAALEGLPGVGAVLAQRIVDWRAANGRFESVRALLQVEGIGEKKLAAMMEFIRTE